MLHFLLPLTFRRRLPRWLRCFARELQVKSQRLTAPREWVGQLAFVTCAWGCAEGMFMARALRVNRALKDVLIYG